MRPVNRLRIAIVHRNRLFRECLASVLSQGDRFRLFDIDPAGAESIVSTLEAERFDAVLIDLDLPEDLALGLTQLLQQRVGDVKVVILAQSRALAVHDKAEDRLVECLAAGAHACVLEESSLQELETALDKVAAGERHFSAEIIPVMCDRLVLSARVSSWRERPRPVELTPRELQIVGLIADDLSNKQIARRLSISLYTVKNHLHNVFEKLQVENRLKAVEVARRRGWLENLKVLGSSDDSR